MTLSSKKKEEVSQTLARLKAEVLAVVCAALGGLGLFAMTAWLVIKGGPTVGQHLQLLSNFFIGYSVTWGGSVVGFFYGALAGGATGWAVGTIYNAVLNLRQR